MLAAQEALVFASTDCLLQPLIPTLPGPSSVCSSHPGCIRVLWESVYVDALCPGRGTANLNVTPDVLISLLANLG